MKQQDIDRWANRQARMHRREHMPAVNWALMTSIVVVVFALIIILLKAAGVL